MATKKEAKKKYRALVDFKVDKKETGTMRLWGIDFDVKDGKLTAEIDPEIAKAMLDAERIE